MLSLFVFLLIVAETMPPTSDAVPLIGKSNLMITAALRSRCGHYIFATCGFFSLLFFFLA